MKTTIAQQFVGHGEDNNELYDRLCEAAINESVSEDQNWTEGQSRWTFSDGSVIVLDGPLVKVEDPINKEEQ